MFGLGSNDENNLKPLGAQICHASTGAPCDDGFFTGQTPFVRIGEVRTPKAGDAIVVSLSDPFNVLTDNRTIAIAFDDDSTRLAFNAKQLEGSSAKYLITEKTIADFGEASFAGVWCDADLAARIQLLSSSDATKFVEDANKGAIDAIGDAVGGAADAINKAAEAQRIHTRNMIIGAAVFVVAIAVIAAYVLPKIKLPSANIG